MKNIARLYDSTAHCGAVIKSIPPYLNGKPMAGNRKLVMCTLCKGPFPIV